jgi:hypothetical protein
MARLGALAALVGALVALHACRTVRATACVPSTTPQSWSIMVAAPAGADGQRVLNSVQLAFELANTSTAPLYAPHDQFFFTPGTDSVHDACTTSATAATAAGVALKALIIGNAATRFPNVRPGRSAISSLLIATPMVLIKSLLQSIPHPPKPAAGRHWRIVL